MLRQLIRPTRRITSISLQCNRFRTTDGGKVPEMSPPLQYLRRHRKKKLAYKHVEGSNVEGIKPGVIYCGGFQMTKDCHRARAIEDYCRENHLSSVRFDYEGVGDSEGDLTTVTFDDWKDNVLAMIDQLTTGPQILVGNGMGAWLATHAALERPYRIHSLISVSGAFDLQSQIFQEISSANYKAIEEEGFVTVNTDSGDFIISKKFLDSAKNHFLLSTPEDGPTDHDQDEQLPITCPVRFLHGLADHEVDAEYAIQMADRIETDNVILCLSKDTDHTFARPENIQMIFEELNALINPSESVQKLSLVDWGKMSKYSESGKLRKVTNVG